MLSQVTAPTKPLNLQRLAVVVVVHLGLLGSAYLARRALDLAALQVLVRIRSCLVFEALRRGHRYAAPILAHLRRLARLAVGVLALAEVNGHVTGFAADGAGATKKRLRRPLARLRFFGIPILDVPPQLREVSPDWLYWRFRHGASCLILDTRVS